MTEQGERRLVWLRRFGPATARELAEGTGAERVETVAVWCRRRPEVEDAGELVEVGRSGAHPRLYRARRDL